MTMDNNYRRRRRKKPVDRCTRQDAELDKEVDDFLNDWSSEEHPAETTMALQLRFQCWRRRRVRRRQGRGFVNRADRSQWCCCCQSTTLRCRCKEKTYRCLRFFDSEKLVLRGLISSVVGEHHSRRHGNLGYYINPTSLQQNRRHLHVNFIHYLHPNHSGMHYNFQCLHIMENTTIFR